MVLNYKILWYTMIRININFYLFLDFIIFIRFLIFNDLNKYFKL